MDNGNFINQFGLTTKQAVILYSMEYIVTKNDIESTKDVEVKKKKELWLQEWKKGIEWHIITLPDGAAERIFTDLSNGFMSYVDLERKKLQVYTPMYLILLETVLFRPYYPLSAEDAKKWKGLELNEKNSRQTYKTIAIWLNIDEKYPEQFQNSYKSAIKSLTGFWTKVLAGSLIGAIAVAITAGAAAPWIAAHFGAVGLTGAAAITSGMAILGGGAVAAGGFGMAGGFAVIVGGGVLLGGALGSGAGVMLATTPEFTLSSAAKMEVVCKDIILGVQKDFVAMQEVLNSMVNLITELNEKVAELRMDKEKNKKDIENLSKSLKYLQKAFDDMGNLQ